MRFLILIAAAWASIAAASELPMDDALKVTVAQSGFAGTTGTIYEVDTLANFTVSGFVNDVVTEETSDVLPPDAILSLQSLLDQTLSSSNEAAPVVNPMTITVNYQGQEWVVTMSPDATAENTQQGHIVRALAAWMAAQAGSID